MKPDCRLNPSRRIARAMRPGDEDADMIRIPEKHSTGSWNEDAGCRGGGSLRRLRNRGCKVLMHDP